MSSCVSLLNEVINTFEIKEVKEVDNGSSYPQTLIRQYSGDLKTKTNSDDDYSIFSLDNDDNDETKYENMADMVKEQLLEQQYAKIDNEKMQVIAEKCRFLILGFTRHYYKECGGKPIPKEIVVLICDFYPDIHLFCWNDNYVSLKSSEEDNPNIFVIWKKCCLLSSFLKTFIQNQTTQIVPIKKVRLDILELIVQYLAHHKGIKPEEIAKPIRSVKMSRICADLWDANYINMMSKKTIFQVILGANYMDVPSLLHLGCAKIATLIKGKSPEEIKNILADDTNQDETKRNDKEQGQTEQTEHISTDTENQTDKQEENKEIFGDDTNDANKDNETIESNDIKVSIESNDNEQQVNNESL